VPFLFLIVSRASASCNHGVRTTSSHVVSPVPTDGDSSSLHDWVPAPKSAFLWLLPENEAGRAAETTLAARARFF
jgi:hypothetical protein